LFYGKGFLKETDIVVTTKNFKTNNMKKLMLLAVLAAISLTTYAQVGVGTATPHASAALDITSTTSGLLPPRMTQAQRNAISTPAAGLMVYCTDCGANGEPQFYNGTSWVNMVGGTATAIPPPTSTVFVSSGVSKAFMAHNLGADNSLDAHTPVQGIHGNYYQWGILAHVADDTTSAAAISPWNTTAAANGAWADGSKTATDPCPAGFRVPTRAQWDGVIANNIVSRTSNNSWAAGDANFGSAIHWGPNESTKNLTLPAAGIRSNSNGALTSRGNHGYCWSSTELGTFATNLYFTSSNATTNYGYRTNGLSVRCVSE
jgi:uncharacterized protein (TIGR02145 family)